MKVLSLNWSKARGIKMTKVDINDQELWYKDAIFYEVYVRAFRDSNGNGHGDLKGLTSKLDYLQDLGVNCLWLLPIYPSPLNDDGYDIADFYNIHSDYGTLDDFIELVDETHSRGMRIITDLVLNHTSDQHPWFQAARSDRKSPYRDYYVWSDSDDKYKEARIIFVDTEKSNWSWDEQAGQYYWHRFFSSQPDLNYDNPAVQEEMTQVMKFWLDLGVDGFRADAVPYLFEREGTNCENLPETHVYLRRLRRFMDENYPGRILLCEANQWPEDLRPYFGDGDEFHMGFHFPIMPRKFMALKQEDVSPLEWVMERTPSIPETCQWCIFLRNHDELTLEMVTEAERQWMWQEYAPEPRMRLNLGIRRRLAPLLDNNRQAIELAKSLLFTMPGSPIIYYGDEIGMGDNIWLPDRNGVRTPMQWDSKLNAGFSESNPEDLYSPVISEEPYSPGTVNVVDQSLSSDSLLSTITKMIAVRKQHNTFGSGDFLWVPCDSKQVAAYIRSSMNERILVINGLSSSDQKMSIDLPGGYPGKMIDLLTGEEFSMKDDGKLSLELKPYQYLWLKFWD
jgi:maltose alpha-D-glucosyltransferase / alpha-amylase